MDFIQDLGMGKKIALKRGQLIWHNVPLGLPECSVGKLWNEAFQVPGFKDYLPDQWTAPSKVDRDYFFNILTYLAGNWINSFVREAKAIRHERMMLKKRKPPIVMNILPEWAEMLLTEEFTSCKFLS